MRYYINWRWIPCVIIAHAFIAGILVQPILPQVSGGLDLYLHTGLIFYFFFERLPEFRLKRPLLSLLLLLAVFCSGITVHILKDPSYSGDHLTRQITSEKSYPATGTIRDIQKTGSGKTRLLINIEAIGDETRIKNCSGKVLAYLPEGNHDSLSQGNRIIFRARFQPLRKPSNPFAFNIKSYYKKKGIYHQAFFREGDYKILEEKTGVDPLYIAAVARQWALDQFAKHIKDLQPRALLSSITLGYRKDLSRELEDDFAKAGVMHVLAVSGLHVGIIFSLLYFILGLPKHGGIFKRVGIFLCYSLLTAAYAMITGLSPSVVRATVMLWIFLLSYLMVRKNHPLNALAFTALILLTFNPGQVYSVSFQFSFLAVTGILMFYKPLMRLVTSRYRVVRLIWSTIAISIAAQIFILPLLIYYFNQVSVISLVSSLIAIPLCYLILVCGLCILLFQPVAEVLSQWTGWLASHMANVFITSSDWMAALPLAYFDQLVISSAELLLLYVLLSSILTFFFFRSTTCLWIGICFMLLLIATKVFKHPAFKEYGEAVIYANRDGAWIDIYYPDTVFSFFQTGTPSPFGRDEHRLQWRSPPEYRIDPTRITKRQLPHSAFKSGNIICARSFCFGLLHPDSKGGISKMRLERLEFVVLYGSGFWEKEKLLEITPESEIVLSDNLPTNTRTFLASYLQSKDIPYHAISDQGAYTKRFTIH